MVSSSSSSTPPPTSKEDDDDDMRPGGKRLMGTEDLAKGSGVRKGFTLSFLLKPPFVE